MKNLFERITLILLVAVMLITMGYVLELHNEVCTLKSMQTVVVQDTAVVETRNLSAKEEEYALEYEVMIALYQRGYLSHLYMTALELPEYGDMLLITGGLIKFQDDNEIYEKGIGEQTLIALGLNEYL